jgi:predicted phage terminase large subunit-like protein
MIKSADLAELYDFAIDESELIRSIYQESLYEAFRISWPTIVHEKLVESWYFKYLCDEVQKVLERVFLGLPKEYDLIINMPPSMGKSAFICIVRAWAVSRMPSFRSIIASYSHTLAMKMNVKTRDIIQSEWFQSAFPEVRIRDDYNTKAHYMTTEGGECLSAGVDGTITGFHAHALFWDDLLNAKQAASEADLENVKRFDEETYPSRVISREATPIIGIMQRLHEQDPTGRRLRKALKDSATPVKLICLPATLEYDPSPKRLSNFYTDGLLDPIRLPQKQCDQIKADSGEMVYAGQYGQQPVPREGGMFKVDRFRIIPTIDKPLSRIIRYWDKAGSKRKKSAFTAGVKMGVAEWSQPIQGKNVTIRQYYVLDVLNFQERAGNREAIILETAKADGPEVAIWMEQEPGSGGLDSAEMTITNLGGFQVHAELPKGDKVARADAFASQVDVYNVALVHGEWTEDFKEQLRLFPNGRLKDMVDAAAGAFRKLNDSNLGYGVIF